MLQIIKEGTRFKMIKMLGSTYEDVKVVRETILLLFFIYLYNSILNLSTLFLGRLMMYCILPMDIFRKDKHIGYKLLITKI